MLSFLIALQFLTRIPVTLPRIPSERAVANAIAFYPLVGLIIGVIMLTVAGLFSHTQPMLLAGIVLTVWVLLTGGLHLDGLADSADAWAGGLGDKDKTLDIMKDPYCGPAAVVTLVLILLIKFSALISILQTSTILYLLLPPLLARAMVPLLFITTPYVRDAGLGRIIAQHFTVGFSVLSMFFSVLVVMLIFGHAMWLILFIVAIGFIAIRWLMMKRLGGATGDTIGALIELTETSTLIAIAML